MTAVVAETDHAIADYLAEQTVVEQAAEASNYVAAAEQVIVEQSAAVAEHAGLFADPYTWVSLSALLFAGLAFKMGKKPILAFLDGRRDNVRRELEEAKQLKLEAERLLAEYQDKHDAAMSEAAEIITHAQRYAEQLKQKAEREMKEHSARQETLLLNRITAAQKQAVNDIRNQAVDLATLAAEKMIRDNIAKTDATLVEETIGEIKKSV